MGCVLIIELIIVIQERQEREERVKAKEAKVRELMQKILEAQRQAGKG